MHVERVSVDSNFFDDLGADSMVMAQFCARVRKRPDLPSVSIKDIYQHPTISKPGDGTRRRRASPRTCRAGASPRCWPRSCSVERVSVDSNFFDDLGADSMVMAQFCARVRKRPDLPSVSMKDIYQHPTIASLATALADAAPSIACPQSPARRLDLGRGGDTGAEHRQVRPLRGAAAADLPRILLSRRAGHRRRATSGSRPATGVLDIYLRSVISGGALFLFLFTLPILAKWMLIGRWKPRQIRIWSLAYVRFWIVKTLVRRNPLVLFAGSPLYTLYLRALGAKVGRGVVIFVHARAGLHRPAHHRRRHGHPQGLVHQRLPSPRRLDPDRPDHHRQGRVHRRGDGDRHRHLDGRRGPARPRLLAARRSGRARRRALARVPGAADRGGLPDGRSGSVRHPAQGRLRRLCNC